ncbi:MAG: serine/threonine protein kinase, partial [Nocardiopsaceae bacterium]|nr:serine/threonine protein kinase [Nocardiopsaceae bacterium]
MAPPELRVQNGRFTLTAPIGSGGQARVWLGDDQLLDRSVALKQLVPRNGGEGASAVRSRAINEARAMAKVRHPAIVTIYEMFFTKGDVDTGFIDGDPETGTPWLVMEYVDGRSLQDLIDRPPAGTPLGDATIARIGLEVLDGLAAVHRAGVVHRDVKPDNILIAGDPAAGDSPVYLVDFGAVRISGSNRVTQPNHVMGTLAYVSPERLNHEEDVPAADLWSLGATLYCAVDGEPPFPSVSAIRFEQPPPPRRRSELTGIIFRMLVKDPEQRAKAGEVRDALEEVGRGGTRAGRTVPDADPHGDGGYRQASRGAPGGSGWESADWPPRGG